MTGRVSRLGRPRRLVDGPRLPRPRRDRAAPRRRAGLPPRAQPPVAVRRPRDASTWPRTSATRTTRSRSWRPTFARLSPQGRCSTSRWAGPFSSTPGSRTARRCSRSAADPAAADQPAGQGDSSIPGRSITPSRGRRARRTIPQGDPALRGERADRPGAGLVEAERPPRPGSA